MFLLAVSLSFLVKLADVTAEVNKAQRRSLGHWEPNHLGSMADHYDVDYCFFFHTF